RNFLPSFSPKNFRILWAIAFPLLINLHSISSAGSSCRSGGRRINIYLIFTNRFKYITLLYNVNKQILTKFLQQSGRFTGKLPADSLDTPHKCAVFRQKGAGKKK